MNERIKQLAEQADLEFDDDESLGFGSTIYYVAKEDMEKFAELIVRECVQLALGEKQRYGNISHRDMTECAVAMDNYQLLLKEHFGVEE